MKKPEEELKAGDMVFFQRRDEAYVMHRIHHINKEGKLFIIGDAQVDMEGPIDKEQVFAIITKVKAFQIPPVYVSRSPDRISLKSRPKAVPRSLPR